MLQFNLLVLLWLFFAPPTEIPAPEYNDMSSKGRFEFIPNLKQWEREVLFKADIPGGKLFLQKNSMTYLFYDSKALHDHHHEAGSSSPAHRSLVALPSGSIKMHAVEVEFLNSNKNPLVFGSKKKSTFFNYFLGDDSTSWSTGIKASEEVHYQNIYNQTDLKIYSTSKGLKYDFIVKPGADPSLINLQYSGAEALYLKNNNLVVKTTLQTIYEQEPVAYQLINKDTVFVPCGYKLDGDIISFQFPRGYRKDLALIIDPLLIFSTYSGSTADNWGFTATYDDDGNVYTAGIVFNTGFPVQRGAFQTGFAGNLDIGILKFDSTGTNLLYSTFLGGREAEVPQSIVVNNSQELILMGTSSSLNFPTTPGAFQRNMNGGSSISPLSGVDYNNGSDIVVCKFHATGRRLLSSTYIGGSGNDGVMPQFGSLTRNYGDQFRGEVLVDEENNIYVASNTASQNFPVVNAFQPSYQGGATDGVIFKFNYNLSTLIWSSFLGGSGNDAAYSVKFDHEKNLVVVGGTNSSNFYTTPGVIKPGYSGGIDGFLTKVDASGTSILQSTYIGTSSYDQVYFVDIDQDGGTYVLGQTLGSYPVTAGVYSNNNGKQFIHKVNNDFSTTLFSTVFGSGSTTVNITPNAFMVNDCGNIFVSGWGGITNASFDNGGNSTGYLGGSTYNLPITSDAFQTVTDGTDFYLMVLEKDASSLMYGTYFGGAVTREHVDGGTSRFDKKGIVYQAVCARCGGFQDYPTTPGVWSNTNNSQNCNNGVFKFDLATLKADFVTNNVTMDQPGYNQGCTPLTVVFENTSIGGKDFEWDLGDGTTSTLETGVVHTYETPGIYKVTLKAVDEKTCKKVDYAYGEIRVFEPHFLVGNDVATCQGDPVQLYSEGGISYSWTPSESLDNPNTATPYANPSETTTYKVHITDVNGCTYEDSVKVTVIPEVVADFNYVIINGCESLPLVRFINNSIGTETYSWDFGDGSTSTETNPIHEFQEEGEYKISLHTSYEFCEDRKEVLLPLRFFQIPNIFTPNGDYINDSFEIISNVQVGLVIYNRWGKEIYKNPDYKNDWTAESFPVGIYFYEVSLPDQTICKGWLQVLR